jgi:hypothetical protein
MRCDNEVPVAVMGGCDEGTGAVEGVVGYLAVIDVAEEAEQYG